MENKTINLELTIDQVNLVLSGLSELPFKLSVATINGIQKQVAEQIAEINKASQPSEQINKEAIIEQINKEK